MIGAHGFQYVDGVEHAAADEFMVRFPVLDLTISAKTKVGEMIGDNS